MPTGTLFILNFPYPFPESKLVKIDEEHYVIKLQITKIPQHLEYIQDGLTKELDLDNYILSPFSSDYNLFVYNFRGYTSYNENQYNSLYGLIKVGPVQKNYTKIQFADLAINSFIYESENIDAYNEYLWIKFHASQKDFYYDIKESGGKFQKYEINFQLGR